MTKIIFATNNQNKVDEIKSLTEDFYQIISLKESGIEVDIPELHDTLEDNAGAKSAYIYELTGEACFSEDTGLEVDALGGEPGVRSARYAGEEKNAKHNIEKLLSSLQYCSNRKARFRTVISFRDHVVEKHFEGTCDGQITMEPKGEKGFGYDAVFVPENATKTFAEMLLEEKNYYSHRKKAFDKFMDYLSQNGKKLFH